MSQSSGLYFEINAISLILPTCILVRMLLDRKKASAEIAFRRLLFCILMVLISDSVWVLVDGKQGGKQFAALNYGCKMVYTIGGVLMGFYFLWFCLYRFETQLRIRSFFGFLTAVPMIASVLIALSTPFTGWFFSLTGKTNYYIRGPLYGLRLFISYGYMFVAGFYVIYVFHKNKDTDLRSAARAILVCSPLAFLGIIGQIVVKRLPISAPILSVAIALLYVNMVNIQVVTDTLTGVNNRRQFDKYLKSQVDRRYFGQNKLFFLMFDMDDFKPINDTFGHDVGDKALRLAADGLKNVFGGTGGFIARLGGDEFAVLIEAPDVSIPRDMARKLEEGYNRINESGEYPFKLSISTGIAEFDEDSDDELSLLKKADLEMYTIKRAKKVSR